MRHRSTSGRYLESASIALAQRRKAERRARRPRIGRKTLWAVQRMQIAVERRDWLLGLILGPDTRSLTGRILGDPLPRRSALYAKKMGWA